MANENVSDIGNENYKFEDARASQDVSVNVFLNHCRNFNAELAALNNKYIGIPSVFRSGIMNGAATQLIIEEVLNGLQEATEPNKTGNEEHSSISNEDGEGGVVGQENSR